MKGNRTLSPFGLRMSPDMREWLKRVADNNHHSMNSEVIIRLEASRKADARAAKEAAAKDSRP